MSYPNTRHPQCSDCRHTSIEVHFVDGPLKGERKVVQPKHSIELHVPLPTEFKVSELTAAPRTYTSVPVGIYQYKRHIRAGVIEMEFRGVRV